MMEPKLVRRFFRACLRVNAGCDWSSALEGSLNSPGFVDTSTTLDKAGVAMASRLAVTDCRRDESAYIAFVIRSVVLRTLTALAALTSGLAAGSTALAHGVEHSRLVHAVEHFDATDDHDSDGHSHGLSHQNEADPAPAEHAHAKLDAGTIRISVDVGLFVTAPSVECWDLEPKPAPVPVAGDRVAFTDHATGPPPQTRAPPIC